MELRVPAPIGDDAIERVRELAVSVFALAGCSGLARCDFFVEPDGSVLVNEINTMPGFTDTSVYAKLFEATGIAYPELCDRLVESGGRAPPPRPLLRVLIRRVREGVPRPVCRRASRISRQQTSEREDACVAGASTADVLRLLSAGATGAILMALGEGPLRTMELTERVPGYAPRTIYRYAGKLAELDVIARDEEPGVPSKVVHSLTDACGSELYELVNRYADASLTRLPDGRIDAQAWASVGLLGDLWETGMVGELACEALSPTELAQGDHGLSYHQVNRRAGIFKTNGLLTQWESPGGRRCYALTEKTRRKMGLLAGIARWRHRHVVAEDEEGMTAPEMATVLRAALRLATLPDHKGRCLRLDVVSEDDTAAQRARRSGPRSKPTEPSTAAPAPLRTRTAGEAAGSRPGSRSSSTAAPTRCRSAARRRSSATASTPSTRPSGPPPSARGDREAGGEGGREG